MIDAYDIVTPDDINLLKLLKVMNKLQEVGGNCYFWPFEIEKKRMGAAVDVYYLKVIEKKVLQQNFVMCQENPVEDSTTIKGISFDPTDAYILPYVKYFQEYMTKALEAREARDKEAYKEYVMKSFEEQTCESS